MTDNYQHTDQAMQEKIRRGSVYTSFFFRFKLNAVYISCMTNFLNVLSNQFFSNLLDTTKHCIPKKQDIFMIIDSSRSIGQNIYPRLRRFIRRLVNKLDISNERTHVGILQASDYRRTQYEMKLGEFTNSKEIESVINEMGYHEGETSYVGRALDIAIRDNVSAKQNIQNKV